MTKLRNRRTPYEEWSRGDHGFQFACVECYIDCVQRRRSGCRVYKTIRGADFHAVVSGHRIEPVSWFAAQPGFGFEVAQLGREA